MTAGSNCATEMSSYTQYCSQSLVMNIKKVKVRKGVDCHIIHLYLDDYDVLHNPPIISETVHRTEK